MTEHYGPAPEDLAAYALGSVEAEEHLRIGAHIVACSACASLLAEYRAVVGSIPAGLEPVGPPASAWETIHAVVRRGRQRSSSSAVGVLKWLRAASWPAAAALFAFLAFWNISLQRELTRRSPGPAPGPEVEALSRRPGRVLIFQGTGRPSANARIFVAVDGGGHLAVSGLTPLPQSRTYQLWFIRKNGLAVSGATFAVDASGRAWVKVAVPPTAEDIRLVTVTEEPFPGSAGPTGADLLAAVWTRTGF